MAFSKDYNSVDAPPAPYLLRADPLGTIEDDPTPYYLIIPDQPITGVEDAIGNNHSLWAAAYQLALDPAATLAPSKFTYDNTYLPDRHHKVHIGLGVNMATDR